MNEKEVIKPMTLLKEDFTKNLIDLCNNSKLPFFILEYILKDVYIEVKDIAKKQYDADLMKYTQLNNENNKHSSDLLVAED